VDFPVVRLAQPRAVRLVATARLRAPVLHLLLADPAAARHGPEALDRLAADLAEIEGGTSARLSAQAALASTFPAGRPHANFVNAAFAYFRPREANRFNDATTGAWYAALATDTAIAEVTFHIARELGRVNDWHASIDWAELWASFAGAFVDLREVSPPPDCLHAEITIGYPAGNALARAVRAAEHNGIVYPSVRQAGGTCLVALWPHAVQSVAQGAVIRTAWQGAPQPQVQVLQPAPTAV
jgi:RES domain-containing protein